MLNTLIESAPATRGLRGSVPNTLFSVGLHAVLLYIAVRATMPPTRPADPQLIVPDLVIARPRQPLAPAPSVPRIPHLVAPARIPTSIPAIDPDAIFDPRTYTGVGVDTAVPGPVTPAPDAAAVFWSNAVDQPPVALSFPPPDYPTLLREAGVEGTVVLEAVIDTSGRAEAASIRVIRSTNRAFESPARESMRRALFRPGRLRGQVVRVLVHLPMRFVIPHNREP